MLVFQMHTEVNQRLQEVASFKRDKYFKEEIDLVLNKAMYRLIEEGVRNKFQDTQVRLSHLTALLKKNKIGEVIKPGTSEQMYQEGLDLVYSVVPPDLYWLVNARAETISDPLNCETAPTLATNTLQEWVATVAFPSPNVVYPFYNTITITSTVLGVIYTAPTALQNAVNANSKFAIINNIIETCWSKTNVKVYFERYRDTFAANSFIFVAPSSIGTVSITGGAATTSAISSATSYIGYNRAQIANITSKTVGLSPVKVHEEDDLYSSLRNNQFYESDTIEVSMDQTYDFFILYRDESFLVTRMYYDYIRKPKSISLDLGQNCELADSLHPKIIDLAVELLRLDTKDQAYQQTTQDIQLRTN